MLLSEIKDFIVHSCGSGQSVSTLVHPSPDLSSPKMTPKGRDAYRQSKLRSETEGWSYRT